MNKPMNIKGFELINEDKVNRAINGTVGSKGSLVGGVGADASDDAKLAEYDRLGGLVKFNGDIVEKGSFYDFAARAPKDTPEVMLSFNINGKKVLVPADQEFPAVVRAAKLAEQGDMDGAALAQAEEVGADGAEEEKPKSGSLIGGGRRGRAAKKSGEDAEE